MKTIKSLEEHVTYVEHLCRISFFFARRYLAERLPEVGMGDLLRKHTPLLYHGLNHREHQPKWESNQDMDILLQAEKLAQLQPEEFEEEMWSWLKPYARERAEINYPNAVGVKAPPHWNCGSLAYDPPREPGQTRCGFHIANAVGPHSIFENPDYLPMCFQLLMTESELRFGFTELGTTTWLNDRPRWQALFPQEWLENMSPAEPNLIPGWSVADWGQIIDGRGTVVPEKEQKVRDTGRLPYSRRSSHCSFKAMRQHLKKLADKRSQ